MDTVTASLFVLHKQPPEPSTMTGHTVSLFTAVITSCLTGMVCAQGSTALRGPCTPPTAIFTSSSSDPAFLCQGDAISVNGADSEAAQDRTIQLWIWSHGANNSDTSATPSATLQFATAGVHEVILEVIDDMGCTSAPSPPMIVLVSASPDFSGTTAPLTGCVGDVFQLVGVASQPPMIDAPEACTSNNNSMPLLDTPTPSISLLQVSDQPTGTITNIAQLGDICMEIEHSYLGDLVLTVSCPNGQSVVLHQQGGGGTFLGDANDTDGSIIVPGTCFQYCFGLDPEFGTLAQSSSSGQQPNTIPVSQGIAIAPGRYTSIQPLTQLLGCPFNGTWTFASADLFGADNGYLCGWCISFGETPDSSYMALGPVLGGSADSSFWSGTGVVNTPGSPGVATFSPPIGDHIVTYTVLDSYGCTYDEAFDVSIGTAPEVTIVNDPDLGLLCAQVVGGPVAFQWSFGGQPVDGAAGACYTPPGPGVVSVAVVNAQGCSDDAVYLTTASDHDQGSQQAGFFIFPNPTNGTFTLLTNGVFTAFAELRLLDMAGRVVLAQPLGAIGGSTQITLDPNVAPGIYSAEMDNGLERSVQRVVVH